MTGEPDRTLGAQPGGPTRVTRVRVWRRARPWFLGRKVAVVPIHPGGRLTVEFLGFGFWERRTAVWE